jgi:hypothetical protein
MTREEIRDLAAGYALGGLDGDDRGRFEALLRAGDREAVAALRDFEATLVELAAESAAPPPPGETARPIAVQARRRRFWWPVVWAAAMAGGIAAIAVGLVTSGTYERRASVLAREAAALRADLGRQQAVMTLLRDPATQIVSLSGLDPDALGADLRIDKKLNDRFKRAWSNFGANLPPLIALVVLSRMAGCWQVRDWNAPLGSGAVYREEFPWPIILLLVGAIFLYSFVGTYLGWPMFRWWHLRKRE